MSWLPSTGGAGADPQTAVNTADIATIEGEQTTQDGLIATNTSKISYTDSAQVSTNTSNIATNASGVSTNATTVFNLGTDVAGHHSRLATIDSDQVTQDSVIAVNTAKTGITSGESAKLAHLTVTQAVDLDSIETRVNELDASVVLMGTWDASAGTFPGSGSASSGQSWIVSVAGTVDGVAFVVNDRLLAIVDPASASTYAGNWHKLDYTDQVLSVGGLTGAVSDVDVVSGGVAGVGTDSVVIGPSASSAGASSAAVGHSASAAGLEASAFGKSTSAAGDYSTAVGRTASAAGIASSAFGYATSVDGNYSSAVGRLASAAGNYSAALGSNTSAAGPQSTAVGHSASAVGTDGSAFGRQSSAGGAYSLAVGRYSSAGGSFSAAIGSLASAAGDNSVAIGRNTSSTASGAVAIGTNVVAATADTTSVNNLEVQGSLNVVGGFEPAGTGTGTSLTLAASDANRTTIMSNAAQVTVTIPLNSAEPFAIGAQFALHSTGAGGVTLSTTGITLNGSSPNTTIAQNEVMVLEKTGTNTWSVYGGTSA